MASPLPPGTICSARGCRAPAAWALRWNNPRLHDPQRRKTWLACHAHRSTLTEFLGSRGFLRESVPVGPGLDLDSLGDDGAAGADVGADFGADVGADVGADGPAVGNARP